MVTFEGNLSEFKKYIGPRLRNVVQYISRKHKLSVAACEHCGSSEKLEAAHVKGRNRNVIIEEILSHFLDGDVYRVDLGKFEDLFKNEHNPVEKSIIVLCHDCHLKYDAKVPKIKSKNEGVALGGSILPISLEPSDITVFRSQLLRKKEAVMMVYYASGAIEEKVWKVSKLTNQSNILGNLRSRPEFRSGAWQAQEIIKVHVKVEV